MRLQARKRIAARISPFQTWAAEERRQSEASVQKKLAEMAVPEPYRLQVLEVVRKANSDKSLRRWWDELQKGKALKRRKRAGKLTGN